MSVLSEVDGNQLGEDQGKKTYRDIGTHRIHSGCSGRNMKREKGKQGVVVVKKNAAQERVSHTTSTNKSRDLVETRPHAPTSPLDMAGCGVFT